jgi:hypothetical protein
MQRADWGYRSTSERGSAGAGNDHSSCRAASSGLGLVEGERALIAKGGLCGSIPLAIVWGRRYRLGARAGHINGKYDFKLTHYRFWVVAQFELIATPNAVFGPGLPPPARKFAK